MDLSSVDNGGLSGLSTVRVQDAASFVKTTKVKPGTAGFDNEAGFPQYRVLPPVVEGQLTFYLPAPGTKYVIYCAVSISGSLVWKPVMLYQKVVNTLNGESTCSRHTIASRRS